jgi:hypothetical protein
MKRARALSPFFNISDNGTPFLILAGGHDWLGDEPKRFYEALKEKRVDSEFKVYPTAKHAFIIYGYSATLEETTQAILDLDAFLVKRGLLDGPTSIKMPQCITEKRVIASIAGPFTGRKALKRDGDFPGFLTVSLKVKPAKKFKGTLFTLTGRYGCSWLISNSGHDFRALRLRQRGKQIRFEPGVWQNVSVSLGKDKVILKVGDQVSEIPNPLQQGFVSNEIVFGDGLDAEIKDVEVHGYAM